MTGMIILSFALGYPVFMVLVYVLYKALFTPLDQVVEERKRAKAMLLVRARRTRKSRRRRNPISIPETSPVFAMAELSPSHS